MLVLVVSMVVVLVVLFLVMVTFMQKVIRGDVMSATQHLDKQAQEYAAKEKELNQKLEDIKRQGQEIVAAAQKEADAKREEAAKQAKEQQDKIIAAAHAQADEVIKQADAARLALLADMENKIDERAVDKAVELLSGALPESLRSLLHERWVAELINTSFEALDRLKVPEDISTAGVVSAFALSDDQRATLQAKLSAKIGRQIQLQESVDQRLIAGLVVAIGSLSFDGSVKFRIQEAARG